WNSVVGKNDLIYIVGDFSFKKAKDTENLLRQLNGDKVLIKGNHDIFLDDKTFDKILQEMERLRHLEELICNFVKVNLYLY
ncbi:MAG: hydrolase, partial [Lachnospiraceae bacterium]|nr:hydrolase [Lachnospiraceae bacterium]